MPTQNTPKQVERLAPHVQHKLPLSHLNRVMSEFMLTMSKTGNFEVGSTRANLCLRQAKATLDNEIGDWIDVNF